MSPQLASFRICADFGPINFPFSLVPNLSPSLINTSQEAHEGGEDIYVLDALQESEDLSGDFLCLMDLSV